MAAGAGVPATVAAAGVGVAAAPAVCPFLLFQKLEAAVNDEDQEADDDGAQPVGHQGRARRFAHVDARALRRGGGLFLLETPLARRVLVEFERARFGEADVARVGLDEGLVEDAARKGVVVVGLDGFEVAHGDARLLGDFAQVDAALKARATQLFAEGAFGAPTRSAAFGCLF